MIGHTATQEDWQSQEWTVDTRRLSPNACVIQGGQTAAIRDHQTLDTNGIRVPQSWDGLNVDRLRQGDDRESSAACDPTVV